MLSGGTTEPAAPEPTKRKRRKMSAAGRKAIAEAQRKRWATPKRLLNRQPRQRLPSLKEHSARLERLQLSPPQRSVGMRVRAAKAQQEKAAAKKPVTKKAAKKAPVKNAAKKTAAPVKKALIKKTTPAAAAPAPEAATQ